MREYPFNTKDLEALVQVAVDDAVRQIILGRLEEKILEKVNALVEERMKESAKGAAAMAKLFDALRDVAAALREAKP